MRLIDADATKETNDALNELKNQIIGQGFQCHLETYQIAITALEKQIPRKPKMLTYKLLIEGGWKYECPCCGCAVGENAFTDYEYIERFEPYCGQCGQAIDWKGEKR